MMILLIKGGVGDPAILRAAIKSVSNKASVIASKMRKRCKPSLNYCCNFVDDGEAI